MHLLHYNDEEHDLHRYLADRGHTNVILPADADPFLPAQETAFDGAFIGLHPHGLELIRVLHRRNSDCLVTMITADRNTRMAVDAMKLGAFDYLLTPLDFAEVERAVIMMMREQQSRCERQGLAGRLARTVGAGAIEHPEHTADLPRGTLKEIIASVEQRAILRALADHEGNISQAAAALAVSRTTLYTKLRTCTRE